MITQSCILNMWHCFVFSTKPQTILPTVDDEAVQRAVEDVAAAVAHQETEPLVQHLMSHDLGHRESVLEQFKPITV